MYIHIYIIHGLQMAYNGHQYLCTAAVHIQATDLHPFQHGKHLQMIRFRAWLTSALAYTVTMNGRGSVGDP